MENTFSENATIQAATGGEVSQAVNENMTETSEQQNQNISILENANTDSSAAWEGDPRYFQTGKKAGQLRPAREAGGVDIDAAKKSPFKGLNVANLKATAGGASGPAKKDEQKAKASKAEKKATEAKVGAAMAMRLLDVVTGWISGGQLGQNFTDEQRKERNEYREELEENWREYLLTLDIPMHPGLVVAFGSAMYIAPAFNTPKGEKRVASLKTRVIGWGVGKFFGGGDK